MGEQTKIEWCDHSWSPWRGCTNVSAGCANCYAEALADRFGPSWGGWGKGAPRIKAKNWNDPRKWNKTDKTGFTVGDPPTTVFPSLCDWLDDEVPIEWLAEFLQLIHATPNLHWLLLTKRPENWEKRISGVLDWIENLPEWQDDKPGLGIEALRNWLADWNVLRRAPANVSIIVSVENQETADRRIPDLLKIPSRIRGLSLEPLLGPVDIDLWLGDVGGKRSGVVMGINWLIVGGESGNGARPCNVEWIRSLVRQGKVSGVPVFVKQLGARPKVASTIGHPDSAAAGWLKQSHPKGGDPAEWPDDLRVREFPDWKGGAK